MFHFIGQRIVNGAYSSLLDKAQDFVSYLAGEKPQENVQQRYDNIKQTAVRAFHHITNPNKPTFKVKKRTYHLASVKQIPPSFLMKKRSKPAARKTPATFIETIINKASNTFKEIGAVACDEAKKKLFGSFSETLNSLIDECLEAIKTTDPEHIKCKQRLCEIKKDLIKKCKNGDLGGIADGIKKMHACIEHQPIYFNGISIFNTQKVENSAILKGLENSRKLLKIIDIKQKTGGNDSTSLNSELNTLCINLSIQATANFIFSVFLNHTPLGLEKIYKDPTLSSAQRNIYILINSSDASFILKKFAKLLVPLLLRLFYHVMKYSFDQMKVGINYHIKQKHDGAINFSKSASILAKLNSAFNQVVVNHHKSGTLDELVSRNMEALQKVPSTDLYKKMQNKFLKTFSLKLPLTAIFWEKIWNLNTRSTLLNIMLYPLKFIAASVTYLALILPELTINALLYLTLRLSIFWKNPLPQIITNSIKSFSSYTKAVHPINLMIVDSLQKIWNQMRSQYHERSPPGIDIQNPVTKNSLDLALKHLFELLEKTPFDTPEELAGFLSNPSVVDKTKTAATRFFLRQNLSAFGEIILEAVQGLFSPEAKEKVVVSILSSINQGFAKKEEVTLKAMTETEQRINMLLSQILSLSIKKKIEEKYTFSPQTPSDLTEQFVQDLSKKIPEFVRKMKQKNEGLDKDQNIKDLARELDELNTYIQKIQLEANSHPDLPRNPRAMINHRYCEPVQSLISQMTMSIESLSFLRDIQKDTTWTRNILKTLTKPNQVDLKKTETLIERSDILLQCFNTHHMLYSDLKSLFISLDKYRSLASLQNSLQKLFYISERETFISKLEQIKQLVPKESLYQSYLVIFKLDIKEDSISQIKLKLEDLLQELRTAQERAANEISKRANDILRIPKETHKTDFFTETRIQQTLELYKEKLNSQLDEILTFKDKLRTIEHYNIKFISTTDAFELMQHFAFGRMIGPMQELLKLIKKPYIWQYGVMNTLCEEFLEGI